MVEPRTPPSIPTKSTPPLVVKHGEIRERTGHVGRGGLALAGGKIYFLVTGLVQQIALNAVLGLGAYGALSTAQSVASIAYNPLVQSGIQGMSRQIAASDEGAAPQTFRRLMKLHSLAALAFALVFLVSAHPLASWLGAPHVAPGIRLFSLILFLYGLYAPVIGYINGRRQFGHQAALDVLSATLRTAGLVAGAYFATQWSSHAPASSRVSFQVQGAVLGFCVAAAIWVLVSFRVSGFGLAGGTQPKTKAYLKVVIPILAGQVLLNLLFQADALLLRRFASDAAASAGMLPSSADTYVGAYRASQLFCFLPFQLLTSLTFVLFPLLAGAQSKGNSEEVSRLIERGLRLALIVAGLVVSTLVAVPEGLLLIVFGGETARLGGGAMRILAGGMGFFALLGVITSAMNSLGAERQSFKLFAGAVLLVALLCFWLTRGDALEPRLLSHIALATSLAMVTTTITAAMLLKKLTGARLSLLSLSRTIAAVALVAIALPPLFAVDDGISKIAALGPTLLGVSCAISGFIVALVLSGELTKGDWNDIKSVFAKKKA